jgi:Zn2+/Cd2+-exporting ATPase
MATSEPIPRPIVPVSHPVSPPRLESGTRAGAWAFYRQALSTSEFLFASLTLLLTLVSWGLYLAGSAESVVATTGIAAALLGGIPIAYGAIRGLLNREMNVDELVTIAIVAAILVGEYWGASLVAFMMLFGKVLEDVTAARADHAIEGLGRLVPSVARVKDEASGDDRLVSVAELRAGDVVVVRPGERLPVDGEVLAGHAAVEEAAITGEPLPVDKHAGDTVFAGTLAASGALEIRATRLGEATALGRIAALVKEAEAERAPIVRVADRWAKWFTPAVLLLAALVYLWQREFLPALTVLVVACPCALVLATPTAVVAGIARGARTGILIKGGARLEAAGHVDAVCLDKTGTLTRGTPVVERVVAFAGAGLDEAKVLAYAAAAERLSEHPLARAVLSAAEAKGVTIPKASAEGFQAVMGQGVHARVIAPGVLSDTSDSVEVLVGRPEFLIDRGVEWPAEGHTALEAAAAYGQTPLAVAVAGRAAGLLALADEVRAEASDAVRELRGAGIRKVVLLTGDRAAPARAAAQAVGIAPEDVHAGLLPEEKVAFVRRLRSEGYRVAMIGDGVNDAPALAAADVAVAMGVAGTDVALAAADIALMTDDLRQATLAILLSRKTVRTVRQNLAFAAAWNVIALAVAAAGGMGPVAGALVHNVGSVAVVVNAARLVGVKLR